MRNGLDASALVEDFMTEDVITLTSGDPVDRARDLMVAMGIHGLPVLDDGQLVGIVTSHDLVDDWPPTEPVAQVMSRNVVTIDGEASVVEAGELMKSELVHHLVVVSERRPIGVITTYDLVDALIARPSIPPGN